MLSIMNLISNSLGLMIDFSSNLNGTSGNLAFISALFEFLSIKITVVKILNKLDLPDALAP